MTEIRINEKKKICNISPLLYGVFFEDINYGGDGGLYGELLANRGFEYYDRDKKLDKHAMCWQSESDIIITDEYPLNDAQTHCAIIKAPIRNTGYCKEGFYAHNGEIFDFMIYCAADSVSQLYIRIVDKDGKELAVKMLEINSPEWKQHELELVLRECDKNAYLEIAPGENQTVRIAFTSLFSRDTYKGRKNGMRRDLAEMVAALKPSFMRFPGGCIVEGRSFENMYCWKDTVGPIEERKTNWNRWQMEEYQQEGRNSADYFQSYGIGFYEYFQFCEDIGAKPIPVVNCGMTCQWHEGLLAELENLDKWIKDAEDLIEFANGDIHTKWGALRAEMGHPEPFGLEYIGIGNEQWGNEYFERYEAFYKALSKTHPEIKLITSAGWTDCGDEFDIAVNWMSKNKEKAYAVDEHFYKSPKWFLNNISRYDNYDRSMPKVFIGEYAAHSDFDVSKRRCNWECALAEAAFLTGVEKNSDHVIMTCYAPLFARENHQQWQPDMIWFNTEKSYGTPSYYVQKLFAENAVGSVIDSISSDADMKISANITNDGTLIVKVVNISGEDKACTLITKNKYSKCIVTEMAAKLTDENSMKDTEHVLPHKYEITSSELFNIKAYSVNIIRFSQNP